MANNEFCKICGDRLKPRDIDAGLMLVCVNQTCDNYWVKKGCEIIMVLR